MFEIVDSDSLYSRKYIKNSRSCKAVHAKKCTNNTINIYRLFSTKTTIDNQEVEQFEQFTWWDNLGPSRALHALNKLRVPFVRDGLINEGLVKEEDVDTATPLKGLSILDVGCGGGIFAESLARLGANITAIDVSPNIIAIAKRHADESNLPIDYIFSSIEEHSVGNIEKYDAVTSSEVIEHVTEKERFIASCAKCVKPNGSIFITTLNKSILTNVLAIYFMESVIGQIPKGTHQIEKCIEPHRLQRLLEDCDLHTKLVHGMIYNFLTNNWSWCGSTSICYALHAVKIKEDQ